MRRANAAAFEARSAFRRRIPMRRGSCWRLSHDLSGRHWCLGFAASAQLPTRVHALAMRARPARLPDSHRSSRATCRSSTSAMSVIHEHDHRSVRPRRSCDGKPPRDEQRLSPGEERRRPNGHSSGVCATRRRFDRRFDVRTPKRIYPNLFGSDTSCRSPIPLGAWNQPKGVTARKSVSPRRGNQRARLSELNTRKAL